MVYGLTDIKSVHAFFAIHGDNLFKSSENLSQTPKPNHDRRQDDSPKRQKKGVKSMPRYIDAKEDDEERLLLDLESSSGRINQKAMFLKREADASNNLLYKISGDADANTQNLQEETEELTRILDESKNHCWLKMGISANVFLLLYLLLTSL